MNRYGGLAAARSQRTTCRRAVQTRVERRGAGCAHQVSSVGVGQGWDRERLVPEQFKLTVRQTTGDKEYYYVQLRE